MNIKTIFKTARHFRENFINA